MDNRRQAHYQVNVLISAENRQLIDMRYENDGHLSEYGHYVIATIIGNILKDPISTKNELPD